MVSYGKYRVVPTTRNGKVAYAVKRGLVLVGVYETRGDAAKVAIQFMRGEEKTIKAAQLAKRTGFLAATVGWNLGKTAYAFIKKESQKRSAPKKKKKKPKKRRH